MITFPARIAGCDRRQAYLRALTSLRDLWKLGLNQLVFDEGVDWWDVFFPVPFTQIEKILLVAQ